MVKITLGIPDELSEQIAQVGDRIPEFFRQKPKMSMDDTDLIEIEGDCLLIGN